MWFHPHGNYPISYNPADGLPEAFSYYGQTFMRRPDPIIVSKPPDSPKSETLHSNISSPPPENKPKPSGSAPPNPCFSFPDSLAAMNLNTYYTHHVHQPPLPPPFQQHAPPPQPPSHRDAVPAKSALKQPQYYTQPHPSMWPTVPPGHDTFILPQGAPTGSHVAAQTVSHQQPLAPDAHKYKCTICGRYRSARYHYKHPLLPGHLPKKTICRRCRENATDSDDASTDSYEAHQDLRSRSRSRRRNAEAPTYRGRSRSQSRGRKRIPAKVSFQSASSSESSDNESDKHRKHRMRSRTPVTEIIRYVHHEPAPVMSRRTRTAFADEPARRSVITTYYDDEEGSPDMESFERTSSRPLRPSTPTPRIVVDENPIRSSHRSCRVRTEYFDGALPEIRGRQAWPRTHPRGSAEARRKAYQESHIASRREMDHANLDPPPRAHGQVRNHHNHQKGINPFMNEDQAWAPQAAVPPVHADKSRNRRDRYERQMSRRSHEESPDGKDDEVIVIETQEPDAVDDYDWYDENGMRVRVREI